LFVALVRPSLFAKPNYWWFKFGMLLGSIIAPIMMGLVYVTTIVPLGYITRAIGKDMLNLQIEKSAKTYWTKRETPLQSMKNQY
jgi:uncharacterized membrane protein